jgi:hypothetical protein
MHFHVIEHIEFLSTYGTTGFFCPKLAAKGSAANMGYRKDSNAS